MIVENWKELYEECLQALLNIENIGAERPDEDLTTEMFDEANSCLHNLRGKDESILPFKNPTK